ncbi:MAG: hypothetical protein ALECFALPRED_005609 [Alectoria fallacina]|uniref:Rhodopsin domain-containing protein n=1 Tax=Alectoria fallacina TaxID=1903189 RepID=A0A8H3IMI8_9LECA|nr:MAG: hypothetical protein ALECFALPRED_005609 [Alectoria fallacina]
MANCFTCDSTPVMHVCVLSAFSFATLLSVIFRFCARRIQRIRLELNDYLCIVGLVFTLASTVFTIRSTVLNSANPDLDWGDKALLVGQLLWITSVTSIRASVLALYIRIFRTPSFRVTCYVVQGFNLAYFVAVVLACCLICRPFAFLWDQSIDGFCGDQKSLDIFIGVFNLLMDITTVALPMPVLWGLQVRMKKKLIIAAMFSMGVAICAITVVRIKMTIDINAWNTQQQYATIALLACLEALLGVINACLPVMKPVFNKLMQTNIFSLFRTRTPTVSSGKPINTSPSNRKTHSSRRGGKYPHISPPRQIVHKDSLLMFSSDLPTDVRAPSIPLPSFSWRPLSRFYLPKAEWEHDTSEMSKDNEIGVMTDRDFGHRPSEGDSPTLPWQPQWRSHRKDAMNRC